MKLWARWTNMSCSRPRCHAHANRRSPTRFQTIAGWEDRGPSGYQLLLRNAPHIGPNAFALPDGRIVVTDQLVGLAQRRHGD